MENNIKKMEMSYEEILRSYREARDKRAQVKILAQLNVCPESTIIDILKLGGIDGRELPRTRGKTRETAPDPAVPLPAAAQALSTAQAEEAAAAPCKSAKEDTKAPPSDFADGIVKNIPGVCIHIHTNAAVHLTVHCHLPAQGLK